VTDILALGMLAALQGEERAVGNELGDQLAEETFCRLCRFHKKGRERRRDAHGCRGDVLRIFRTPSKKAEGGRHGDMACRVSLRLRRASAWIQLNFNDAHVRHRAPSLE
jgi:hypothetical protein